MSMQKWWKGLLLMAGAASAATAGGTAYFYRRVMKRNRMKVEDTMKMSGTDWSRYADLLKERKAWMMSQPHEEAEIMSEDGLKLHGTFFPGTGGAKKLAICLHGYTSQGMSDYVGLSDYYLKRGYAMLLPDARAHGKSEGEYVGFGCLDRRDLMRWIDWAVKRCTDEVQILLHGTSMGGATVLMASGLALPGQIKGIISDCGFTSAKEVFSHVLRSWYHLPAFPMIQIADCVNRKRAGYGLDECNAKREVRKAKIPILLIHGEKDNFVLCYMCREIYSNCKSPAKMVIIKDAAHGESYYRDTEQYEKAMTEFIGGVIR